MAVWSQQWQVQVIINHPVVLWQVRPDIFYSHLSRDTKMNFDRLAFCTQKYQPFSNDIVRTETFLNIWSNKMFGKFLGCFCPSICCNIESSYQDHIRHDSVSLDSAAYPAWVCGNTNRPGSNSVKVEFLCNMFEFLLSALSSLPYWLALLLALLWLWKELTMGMHRC